MDRAGREFERWWKLLQLGAKEKELAPAKATFRKMFREGWNAGHKAGYEDGFNDS
jgi:hypothetical protein